MKLYHSKRVFNVVPPQGFLNRTDSSNEWSVAIFSVEPNPLSIGDQSVYASMRPNAGGQECLFARGNEPGGLGRGLK